MYQEIIKEICEELNIKCSFLSNNWIIALEYFDQRKYIAGYKFDLNNHASALCIDDKYAMYEILKQNNINVIEHNIMYDESNNESYAKNKKNRKLIYDYFYNHHNNIVIKSNTGTCGRGVYHITDESEIDNTLNILFKNNHSISLCPFYNIDEEYRVIILNDKSMITYRKVRPVVTGDGKKLISELLTEFNPYHNYKIDNDVVLPIEKTYSYTWKHNLSNGSIINMNITDKPNIENMAVKVANILNLSFGSVDIIKVNNEYKVLECNSGVMMDNLINLLPDGYNIAKSIYKEAILELFNLKLKSIE